MNKGLTSFRALAFFAILGFHYFGKPAGGYIGVQAFFVLSGFLLTPILINMKENLNGRSFFINFYGRRVLRIFPLYYVYLIITSCLAYLLIYKIGINHIKAVNRFLEQLPWAITYTYNFYHASKSFQHTMLLTHFWALAVEQQFYLIWPLAIYFIPKEYLKKFLFLIIIINPLFRLCLGLVAKTGFLPFFESPETVIYVFTFSHIDAFAIGGIFALYVKSRSSHSVWLIIIAAFTVGVLTEKISTNQISWSNMGYGPYMVDSYKYIWGYSVVNFTFAYILIHLRDKKFLVNFFENSLLNYLGTISYGLYIFHYPIRWIVYREMSAYPLIIKGSVALGITVLLSALSYELMEKKILGLKDKYFLKVKPYSHT